MGPLAGRSDLAAVVGLTAGSGIAVGEEAAITGQRSTGSYPAVKLMTAPESAAPP